MEIFEKQPIDLWKMEFLFITSDSESVKAIQLMW